MHNLKNHISYLMGIFLGKASLNGKTKKKNRKNTNDDVEELYTERASFYDRFFINFLGWGRELEAFFRKSSYLAPTSKVLDAVCGTGVVTRSLYKLAAEKGY